MMPLNDDQAIKTLLTTAKTIAVVGYSNKIDRPSYGVAHALIKMGYRVYFVNPILAQDEPEKIYANLADLPAKIDIVDVFRRAEDVPSVVEAAIKIGAKAIWMQLGIVNEAAAEQAETAGLQVVMDRCIKMEHQRLFSEEF